MKLLDYFWTKPKADTKPVAPVEGRKFFDVAKLDRLNSDWFGDLLSPNQDVKMAYPLIRGRSRDLYKNSPAIKSYVNIIQQSLKPFKLCSKVSNARKGIKQTVTTQIEDAWADFCKVGNFEVSGRYSLNDCLNQMIQSLAVDGEILIRRLKGKGKYGYQIQLIPVDLLAMNEAQTGAYSMGIERDEWEKPINYYLYTKFPVESTGGKLLIVPANEIIHAYKPHMIGAARGLPLYINSMATIKLVDDYRVAELVAAKMGACKSMFYVPKDLGSDLNPSQQSYMESEIQQNHLAPGMAEVVRTGYDVKFNETNHPTTAFASFNTELKKEIAAGMGLSYNTLYSDYEKTSFSSLKAAYNQDKQFLTDLQDLFIAKILDVIFEDFIDMACVSGQLNLTSVAGSYDVYKDHTFIPPAIPFADPLKDIQYQAASFDLGTTSLSELCAAQGKSFTDVLQQRQADRELMTTYGEVIAQPVPTANPALGKPGSAPNTPEMEPTAAPAQKPIGVVKQFTDIPLSQD